MCEALSARERHSLSIFQSQEPPDEIVTFLEEFWDLAWGVDFTLDESGMSLQDSGVPGVWEVTVHDGPQTVAQGLYVEIERLPVPELDPATSEPITYEHFVTAGVMVGQTGAQKAIYGIAQRVAYEGDEPVVVDALTPLGMTDDVGAAVDEALAVLSQIAGAHPVAAEPPYTPDDDPCHCDAIYDNGIAACAAGAAACQLACTAAAVAGIAACLGAGPLFPVCVALILTAQAVCLAGCLALQKSCDLSAFNAWLACEHACQEANDDGFDYGP